MTFFVCTQAGTSSTDEIGVAIDDPSAGGLLAQNGERVAGAENGITAGRSNRNLQAVAEPRPVPENFNFLDVTGAIDPHVFHLFGAGDKGVFTERFAARDHKEDVVGHESENGGEIAGFGGVNPPGHDVADRLFVVLHVLNCK